MAQFSVYRNLRDQGGAPLVVDLQAGLLKGLATRVVAPLRPEAFMRPARHLNPVFEIEGQRYLLSTAELAGVAAEVLGEEVTTLEGARDEIIAALDFLFTGY